MKSHDFAKIMGMLSDLLMELPNKPIEKAMIQILESAQKDLLPDYKEKPKTKTKQGGYKTSLQLESINWQETINNLKEMNFDDAKKYIENNVSLNKITSLTELAKILNIGISGRQKKDNLIHVILKSFERDRLDKTIRSRTKSDKIEEETANKANSADAKSRAAD